MGPLSDKRPTSAVIDLDALAFNFKSSKRFIGSDIKYMAVVKADAYGHGSGPCSMRLESEGVDWFGVAIPEEGAELRRSGIRLPILCLGGLWPGQESMVVDNRLTPVIYAREQAMHLNRYAAEIGVNVDIHVKIDTGMGRVGIRYKDSSAFASDLKLLNNLRVAGLLTHFAAADAQREDDFTNLQMERFAAACDEFRAAGHTPELIDLANSPGAIRHPAARGNLVRLGGALYGLLDDILPDEVIQPDLRPVLSLRSHVAYLRMVPAGESLGYGRTFVTKQDSRIALVPIGYADGYPRGLSNCGRAAIRGRHVSIVGRISMDWTLFDVTDIADVGVGDEVFLIGGEEATISASDIARETGTIGYEITCGISARVPRVYAGLLGADL